MASIPRNNLQLLDPSTQGHPSEFLPLCPTTAAAQDSDIIAGCCFVDTLPFEILSEIFCCSSTLTCEDNGFHKCVMSLSLASPPFSLLSVCKVWREVALATPSLWDSIALSLYSESIPRIKAWMKFSPDLPFHLMFMQRGHRYPQVNPQSGSELFRLFSTESHRWKSLSIQLDAHMAEELLTFLQARKGNPIPIKDIYISVTVVSYQTADTMSDILSLLPLSTAVERLYWDGRYIATTASLLPWKQLKTIKVKVTLSTMHDVVDILSQCTSASVISIHMSSTVGNYHQMPTLYRDPPFLLPLLTSLQLTRWADPMAVLQYFTFPSLRYLWIAVAYRDLFTFENFLKRTPLLETLIIDESGQDQSNSPDGPSEEDMIYYLTIPELCNIPSFKLTFRDAHTVIVDIIQDDPKLTLPPLLCWKEYFRGSRYGNASSFIGWGEHWFTEDLIWTYRQGKFEFTPEYHSEWHNWRDPTWNRPGGKYFRRPKNIGPFKCIPLP